MYYTSSSLQLSEVTQSKSYSKFQGGDVGSMCPYGPGEDLMTNTVEGKLQVCENKELETAWKPGECIWFEVD